MHYVSTVWYLYPLWKIYYKQLRKSGELMTYKGEICACTYRKARDHAQGNPISSKPPGGDEIRTQLEGMSCTFLPSGQ